MFMYDCTKNLIFSSSVIIITPDSHCISYQRIKYRSQHIYTKSYIIQQHVYNQAHNI